MDDQIQRWKYLALFLYVSLFLFRAFFQLTSGIPSLSGNYEHIQVFSCQNCTGTCYITASSITLLRCKMLLYIEVICFLFLLSGFIFLCCMLSGVFYLWLNFHTSKHVFLLKSPVGLQKFTVIQITKLKK